MKIIRSQSGPFAERPYFEASEFDSIAYDELRRVNLLRSDPGPTRIDRFIEKRFGVTPEFEELPDGILGFTKFGTSGAESIVISRSLSEDPQQSSIRRLNATLAHESGHVLLHSHLFALESTEGVVPLFEAEVDVRGHRVLCRSESVGGLDGSGIVSAYGGRWWEYQANQMIGPLLMPKQLVVEAVVPFSAPQGALGISVLKEERREEAVEALAELFGVNPIVVRLRLADICPPSLQLTF